MFFSVTTKIDTRFPNNYQFEKLWVNCDNGWCQTDAVFYKGYNDNYCKITVDSAGATIEHSTPRSFPLWSDTGIVTNLAPEPTAHWMDDVVTIDYLGKISVDKNPVNFTVPTNKLSVDQAKVRIRQILDSKLTKVPTDIKLFCSGGLDTLLLYGMLAGRQPFELVVDDHYEQDAFTKQNQEVLSKFWAYEQIHHWTEFTWLATGSHGDEYFLRGPIHIAMLTAWHDINFGQLLADNPDCYHYHHFNKYSTLWTDYWDNRNRLREEYPTVESLNNQIMNMLINDYQHWHLGNTLTWTPFKDIDIPKILLQCDINDLIPQFLNGRLSQDLIIDYNDNIIDYLSQYKNYNSKENLAKLYKYHRKLPG